MLTNAAHPQPRLKFLPPLKGDEKSWGHEGVRHGLQLNVCTLVTKVRLGVEDMPTTPCKVIMRIFDPSINTMLVNTSSRLVWKDMPEGNERLLNVEVRHPTSMEIDGGVARARCGCEATFQFRFGTAGSKLVASGKKDSPLRIVVSLQQEVAPGVWREIDSVFRDFLLYARQGGKGIQRADNPPPAPPALAAPLLDVVPPALPPPAEGEPLDPVARLLQQTDEGLRLRLRDFSPQDHARFCLLLTQRALEGFAPAAAAAAAAPEVNVYEPAPIPGAGVTNLPAASIQLLVNDNAVDQLLGQGGLEDDGEADGMVVDPLPQQQPPANFIGSERFLNSADIGALLATINTSSPTREDSEQQQLAALDAPMPFTSCAAPDAADDAPPVMRSLSDATETAPPAAAVAAAPLPVQGPPAALPPLLPAAQQPPAATDPLTPTPLGTPLALAEQAKCNAPRRGGPSSVVAPSPLSAPSPSASTPAAAGTVAGGAAGDEGCDQPTAKKKRRRDPLVKLEPRRSARRAHLPAPA